MKGIKKALSFVLTLALILSLFTAFVTTDAAIYDDYIKISTKQDFYNIRSNINGKYYLANDIVFTSRDYTALGDFYGGFETFNTFNGVLDGCGHAISGLESVYGIAANNYGTIKNIEFINCTFEKAGFVDNNHGEILNCKVTDSVIGTGTGTYSAAGVALRNLTGALIEYSSSDGCEIVGHAGIVLMNEGEVNYCVNRSDFYRENSNAVGGIVQVNNNGTVSNCINYGTIDVPSSSAGGICGSNDGVITGCANYGDITTKGSLKTASGIASADSSYTTASTPYIENCINYGVIKAMAADKTYGIAYSAAGQSINCVNMGKVYSGSGYGITKQSKDAYNCYYVNGTGAGTGILSTEIKESTFKDFDFVNTWKIENGEILLRCADEFLSAITAYQFPSKTIYNRGEQLGLYDMKVLGLGSLGTWEELNSSEYTVIGYDSNKIGKQEVTVKSSDKSFDLTVYVSDSIANQTITLSENTCEYTGSERTPVVTVKDRVTGRSLLEGRDYTVEYSNNIYLGTATVTIKGDGNYNGTTSTTFNIVPPAHGKHIIYNPSTGIYRYFNEGVPSYETAIVNIGEEWYYINRGVFTQETNLIKFNGVWYYIQEGRWAQEIDTLHKINGKWFLVQKGIWKSQTSIVKYQGKYFYIAGGKWDSKVNDLKKVKGKWYFIQNGKWDSSLESLHKLNGKWFLVKGGMWNATTGLVEYKGKTFYVKGGKWDSSINTLYKKGGYLYSIKNGKWYSGKVIIKYNGRKYYCNYGYAQTYFSGKVKIGAKTYTVKNGIIK